MKENAALPPWFNPRQPVNQDGHSVLFKFGCCTLLLFFSVAAALSAEASKSPGGTTYPYNSFVIPCTVEAVKFLFSTLCLFSLKVRGVQVDTSISISSMCGYMFPALCYFISNNCMLIIIRELGPATFQITSNLKSLATGILMYTVLGRKLTWLQWKALVLLVIGSIVSQIPSEDNEFSSHTTGYMYVLINCFASGAGGVVSEKMLKNSTGVHPASIHWQNMQLYFFGFCFGMLTFAKSSAGDVSLFFAGFNLFAYATVVSLSVSGLLVSFVLKYMDNFAKCFVSGASITVVALVQAAMKDETISLKMLLGMILTFMAIEQYNLPQ